MSAIGKCIKKFREKNKLSQEDLAKRLDISVDLMVLVENPEQPPQKVVENLCAIFNVAAEDFWKEFETEGAGSAMGEKGLPGKKKVQESVQSAEISPPAPVLKKEPAIPAQYPSIRQYLLSTKICQNLTLGRKLLESAILTPAEKNIILYFLVNALYNYCAELSSVFDFDAYLKTQHQKMLQKFQNEIGKINIPEEEKQEKVNMAQGNIFYCDTMDNIAIAVFEFFADQLEHKIKMGRIDFETEFDMPFTWEVNEQLSKIVIRNPDGTVKDDLKLFDIKVRN